MKDQTGMGVLVHCEISDGRLAPVAMEALGAGGRLAAALGQELSAILIGNGLGEAVQETIAYGAAKVYVADDPSLQDYSADAYLQAMEAVTQQSLPAVQLHEPRGHDADRGYRARPREMGGPLYDNPDLWLQKVRNMLDPNRVADWSAYIPPECSKEKGE